MKRAKWLGLFLAVILALTACSNEQNQVNQSTNNDSANNSTEKTSTISNNTEIPEKLKKPLKIAAISQLSIGTFSSQYIAGVQAQVKQFGGEVQVYNSDNDLAKMASYIDTAVSQKVDGILLDHGRADALLPSVKKAIEAGIPVIAFDNDLRIPGVTVIDQDDFSLAWNSLRTLAQDLNGKGNIVYVWVGGFAPMENRNVIYNAFKQRYPDIKEIAKFGNATNNTALDTQTQMEAILQKYPKGQIDAVFAPWDEFAKGVTRAIQQAGRNEIKVYGIDLSDEDLQMIQQKNSPWVATTATDPTEMGKIQVRFLYQKIAGETVPQVYSVEPHLVEKKNLPSQSITMNQLGKYIQSWGATQTATSPWMEKLAKENKK
jgi:simple sugar transport system substrate-binding protein